MGFKNLIVAGNILVREAIQSSNYIPGAAGWIIRRDGTAELNNVTVRGDLILGTYPAGPYIFGDDNAGSPRFEFRDDTHSQLVFLETDNANPKTTVRLRAGDITNTATGIGCFDGGASMTFYDANRTLGVSVSEATSTCDLVADRAGSLTVALSLNPLGALPDGTLGRLETQGEITVGLPTVNDGNYPSRVADGKVYTTTTTTAIAAADTNVGGANIQSTYVEKDFAYRVTMLVELRGNTAGNRALFKLWNGAVGTTQLGGNFRKYIVVGAATYENVLLQFIFRAAATETIANINLSCNRDIGAGTMDVNINANYFGLVEKIGLANKIAAL